MMLFQQEKENYENEIAKLTNRLKKQGKQSEKLKQTFEELTTTTADLDYAN
jgi:septal ring factor EnvC (AmiA/AmiB activator)